MSELVAKIEEIESCDTLHIVKFKIYDISLSMISLELSDDIKVGSLVKLTLSPSSVAISKNFSGKLSCSNMIDVTIEDINIGKLLTSLKLKFYDKNIESIITSKSAERLELKKGEKVTALIKASDLSISEVIDV